MEQKRAHRRKLFFLVFAGTIGILATIGGGYQMVQFMDSTDFCGRLCHQVMYPEYTAYQASPHSRVECVDCHVGYSASLMVKSKLTGIPQMFATVFKTYDRPIPAPVENLRPARDTCEQCHWPQRFSGDIVRIRNHYLPDEDNTEQVNSIVLKVGGGEGSSARDIHWHVTAKVWYLPMDEARQEIGWVGTENTNGIEEFVDPARQDEITPERIESEKRLMDCIDCHNRATHIFYSPNQLIDTAISEGKIDREIPYIKKQGLEALGQANSTLDEAYERINAIEEYYEQKYPDVYSQKQDSLRKSLDQLREIARLTTFPYMRVDWQTYPNNIGHTEWPGCMRCHGKLVQSTGEEKGKTIDANCNSCHYSLPMGG